MFISWNVWLGFILKSLRFVSVIIMLVSSAKSTVLLLLFTIVNNKALFQMNSEICSINSRYNSDFQQLLVSLTTYKNGTCYIGIKIFNYLPTHIKNLSHNVNQFRLALRDFLHFHSFYILDEYFNPLSAKLNPICHLLALLGAHPILHISSIRVNSSSNLWT